MTLFLCVTLYYELLKRFIDMLGTIRIPLPEISFKEKFAFANRLKSKLAKRKSAAKVDDEEKDEKSSKKNKE
jgi:hypothetical protein